jgi:predicted RNase H-like HicB family nuclease
MKRYTLLAVQQGEQWASLCRELDIASTGATAEEALDTLECAVSEALDYERETGVRAGIPVPPRDLAAFLEHGRGSTLAQTRTVTL